MANTDSILGSSSVYYLHPSDHTGLKLVSQVFDGVGYSEWKRGMILALTSKNKKDFVDGTIEKPSEDSKTFNAWDVIGSLVG
ncbi:unnamed protein product [Amaranthus hypochondriacus]